MRRLLQCGNGLRGVEDCLGHAVAHSTSADERLDSLVQGSDAGPTRNSISNASGEKPGGNARLRLLDALRDHILKLGLQLGDLSSSARPGKSGG